jgi:hypothetical protein
MNLPYWIFLTMLVAQGSESQDLYVAARSELIDDKYERALELFSQVVSRYPESEEADDAQFYIGYAQEHLGRKKEAIAAYSAVIERWPESSRVESARSHRAELAASAPDARSEILDDVFSGSSWELKRDTAMALARQGNLSAADVLEEAMERESSSRQLEILRILKPRVADADARRVVIRGLDPGRSTGVQLRALQTLEPVVREDDVARAIEVLLSSGSASTSVNLEAVRALSAHLDRASTRKAASRALETGEATAVQTLACSTFASHLLSEELRPSVIRLYRESNATSSQLQCLRGLAPRADDLAVAEVLKEAIASNTATAVKLEAVSIASSSTSPAVRATAREALRSGNATSVQLAGVKTLASGRNEEAAAEALETLFRGTGAATSVLLAGLDSVESHLATNAAPGVLALALTSNSATSVELRAVEIATPLVSNTEVRGALVRCLSSSHSTSVVLAAMNALEPRVASDPEVKDAFLRVLENAEMSSGARVRAGDSLLAGADPAISARIADAMEEVIVKARRRGGNADVVEKALSVLERIDRGRADRLRARPRAEMRGGPALLYPAPAL